MNVALKCLGCGSVLRNSDVSARVLCDDCKRFAKLARYGTRCPACRSDDVVYTTESTGQETLFCGTCECIWTRLPASGTNAVVLDSQRLWRGAERRFAEMNARSSIASFNICTVRSGLNAPRETYASALPTIFDAPRSVTPTR